MKHVSIPVCPYSPVHTFLLKFIFCWSAFAHEANQARERREKKTNGLCAWNTRAAGSKVNFDKFNFNAYTSICTATYSTFDANKNEETDEKKKIII